MQKEMRSEFKEIRKLSENAVNAVGDLKVEIMGKVKEIESSMKKQDQKHDSLKHRVEILESDNFDQNKTIDDLTDTVKKLQIQVDTQKSEIDEQKEELKKTQT